MVVLIFASWLVGKSELHAAFERGVDGFPV
jgi:hypothetical protein